MAFDVYVCPLTIFGMLIDTDLLKKVTSPSSKPEVKLGHSWVVLFPLRRRIRLIDCGRQLSSVVRDSQDGIFALRWRADSSAPPGCWRFTTVEIRQNSFFSLRNIIIPRRRWSPRVVGRSQRSWRLSSDGKCRDPSVRTRRSDRSDRIHSFISEFSKTMPVYNIKRSAANVYKIHRRKQLLWWKSRGEGTVPQLSFGPKTGGWGPWAFLWNLRRGNTVFSIIGGTGTAFPCHFFFFFNSLVKRLTLL